MGKGIRLGKTFNIEIDLDWSWFLIFGLVTWSLAEHYLTVHEDWSPALRWSLASITSLLFFVSVLAHELAHSLVSQREGIPARPSGHAGFRRYRTDARIRAGYDRGSVAGKQRPTIAPSASAAGSSREMSSSLAGRFT